MMMCPPGRTAYRTRSAYAVRSAAIRQKMKGCSVVPDIVVLIGPPGRDVRNDPIDAGAARAKPGTGGCKRLLREVQHRYGAETVSQKRIDQARVAAADVDNSRIVASIVARIQVVDRGAFLKPADLAFAPGFIDFSQWACRAGVFTSMLHPGSRASRHP